MSFLFEVFFWLLLGGAVMGGIYLRTDLIAEFTKPFSEESERVTAVMLAWVCWPLTLMATAFYLSFLRLKHMKAHRKQAAQAPQWKGQSRD